MRRFLPPPPHWVRLPEFISYHSTLHPESKKNKRDMALLSVSHVPFLPLASPHLPTGFVKDTPANFSQTSTMQGGQLYIRYLHLRPASQTMQRMPAPCFLYNSTRRRTQSPLRTVTTQDRAEKVQPIVRSRRRLQDPSQSLVRDVLSDALSSRSRIILLPHWRSPVSRSRHDDTARTRH
jgi:hypothetical protein